MDNMLVQILEILAQRDYVTAHELSSHLNISDRTVRKKIKLINETILIDETYVESKARYGYRLCAADKVQFMNDFIDRDRKNRLPDTKKERIIFILYYLLFQKGYTKSVDLLEMIYVSKGTLSEVLKQLEIQIEPYGLYLKRKPNYGIKICGKEFSKRSCMEKELMRKEEFEELTGGTVSNDVSKLSKIVMANNSTNTINFSETAFQKFVHDIYVQIERIKADFLIDELEVTELQLSNSEITFVESIKEGILADNDIHFSETEHKYFLLYFSGTKSISLKKDNFVVSEKINKLTTAILNEVYQQLQIDFRGNLPLRISLNQHIVPLEIRIKYDMPYDNPMLEVIKVKYLSGYLVAEQARVVLQKYYKKKISDDEIGYFAVIFALALKQNEKVLDVKKINILVVCNSGNGISKLLEYRFKHLFNEFLNKIYVCNVLELKLFDFTLIDYIFTTVPITDRVPVPVEELEMFLENEDISTVRTILEKEVKKDVIAVYKQENFWADIDGENREEILKTMCQRISARDPKMAGLYDSVIQREYLSSTDFGNYVAIPHPYEMLVEETCIYIAVLPKPVVWERHPVQVVMLMLIGGIGGNELQSFYEVMTSFIASKSSIERLMKQKKFSVLIEELEKNI